MRKQMTNFVVPLALLMAFGMGACQPTDPVGETTGSSASKIERHVKTKTNKSLEASIVNALSNPERMDTDQGDDEVRKAAEVLGFVALRAGDHVLELEAGGGYYTSLFSTMVGKSGQVVMQNPAAFDGFIKPEYIQKRLSTTSNVVRMRSNFDRIDLADNSIDVVTWFLGPHEFFYHIKGNDGEISSLGDADTGYAEIFRVLKPGGRFIALDHVAVLGAPESVGGTLHRIDPAHITRRAKKAGLILNNTSNALANATDDHTGNVFAPNLRRKTDRFLHEYTKPE